MPGSHFSPRPSSPSPQVGRPASTAGGVIITAGTSRGGVAEHRLGLGLDHAAFALGARSTLRTGRGIEVASAEREPAQQPLPARKARAATHIQSSLHTQPQDGEHPGLGETSGHV